MIRKITTLVLFAFILSGCASLQFPAYIQDKNPYTQRFYADHDQVIEAVKKSLGDSGWQVEGTADPAVYEEQSVLDPGSQNILLYTAMRQTPKILWTTYVRLNVIVRSKNKVSDVEIRYSKVNSFSFKQFKKFKNDKLVKRIFQRITDQLNQSQ